MVMLINKLLNRKRKGGCEGRGTAVTVREGEGEDCLTGIQGKN
jgi:hypothetical protein